MGIIPIRRRFSLVLTFALLSACTPHTTRTSPGSNPAASTASRLPLRPCNLPGVEEELLCGELRVPEDRAQPFGRTIVLFVVVAPALTPNPRADAWVELTGGPGNAATDYAREYVTGSRAYRRDRDVLLVDQRGMGRSNGLYCEGLALHRVSSLFERWPSDSVARCRTRLADSADLRQYSTERAAEDLEAVRTWLGYARLNLFSYSYGTRLALTYMRRYPASVRSAILWGVVPPDFRRPLYYARDGQQALDRLLADCRVDAACAAAFPRAREELAEVLARLDRDPVPVTLTHPETRRPLRSAITNAGFAEALWVALSYPDRAHRLPLVIHRAAQGDFAPFLALDVATTPPRRRYYNAAHLSVVCPEEVQHIRRDEIETSYHASFLPAERAGQYLRACDQWGLPTLPLSPIDTGRVDAPVLIVSGYMDPITPPAWGDAVARELPRSRHVVVRHLSHEADGLLNAECLDQLFLAFLDRPDPATLDTRCVASMRPPPFALPAPP